MCIRSPACVSYVSTMSNRSPNPPNWGDPDERASTSDLLYSGRESSVAIPSSDPQASAPIRGKTSSSASPSGAAARVRTSSANLRVSFPHLVKLLDAGAPGEESVDQGLPLERPHESGERTTKGARAPAPDASEPADGNKDDEGQNQAAAAPAATLPQPKRREKTKVARAEDAFTEDAAGASASPSLGGIRALWYTSAPRNTVSQARPMGLPRDCLLAA